MVKSLFQRAFGEVVTLSPPGEEERRNFFADLLLVQAVRPPARTKTAAERCAEVLPVAEAPGPRVLSAEEQRRLAEQEENTLRELRLFLRDVSDYLEVIRQPMDLSTIMTKIDTHRYLTTKDFLLDVDLICSNALDSLKDSAHAMFASELDPEFDRMCEDIKEARKKRATRLEDTVEPGKNTADL
ncbi:hypothetical protein CRUP_026399 [Coryphaenoides rupestris]|nr:hypothetical protein CRUP_026399 [Coryphaenoides rupestris]